MTTENRSNDADGWIACDDGLHLIQMDKNLSHYGWVFRKVGGGRPYSVREATSHEMAHAQARQHLRIGVAQIAGQAPAPQTHPEPIAWIVDTAFWWTEEEAERDAAATGLPMIPIGAMVDTAEVEQLREENAELAALVGRQGSLLSETAIALRGPESPKTRHSHADIPSRVKVVIRHMDERDALLRDSSGKLIQMAAHLISAPLFALQELQDEDKKMTRARVDHAVDVADARLKDAAYELRRIADALSASAAPIQPAAPYPNRLCHIDYTAHPHRCGCLKGDEEAQRRSDEHFRGASAEPEAT